MQRLYSNKQQLVPSSQDVPADIAGAMYRKNIQYSRGDFIDPASLARSVSSWAIPSSAWMTDQDLIKRDSSFGGGLTMPKVEERLACGPIQLSDSLDI